jgi:hypothetical protein
MSSGLDLGRDNVLAKFETPESISYDLRKPIRQRLQFTRRRDDG